MSSKRAKAKTTKKRPQRATSNVFAMFDQSQIQEFKEAFNMIDQNRDGFIDKEDLHDMLASMGEQRRGQGAEWSHEGCSWSRRWGDPSVREHFPCIDRGAQPGEELPPLCPFNRQETEAQSSSALDLNPDRPTPASGRPVVSTAWYHFTEGKGSAATKLHRLSIVQMGKLRPRAEARAPPCSLRGHLCQTLRGGLQ